MNTMTKHGETDDEIAQDGDVLHVSMFMMDAARRATADAGDAWSFLDDTAPAPDWAFLDTTAPAAEWAFLEGNRNAA